MGSRKGRTLKAIDDANRAVDDIRGRWSVKATGVEYPEPQTVEQVKEANRKHARGLDFRRWMELKDAVRVLSRELGRVPKALGSLSWLLVWGVL